MIIGYVLYMRGLGLHDNSVRTLHAWISLHENSVLLYRRGLAYMIIGYVLYRRGLGLHDNSVRTLHAWIRAT